jgi:HJR/Mrr/RecB family endonuclease
MEFLSNLLLENGFNYYVCDVDRLYHERSKILELARFEHSLQEKKPITLSTIDTMTGYEFEDFLVTIFTKSGYTVERRTRSHEQGLDFLLLQHGERTAVQVKRHNDILPK